MYEGHTPILGHTIPIYKHALSFWVYKYSFVKIARSKIAYLDVQNERASQRRQYGAAISN